MSLGDSLSITLWVKWDNFSDPCVGPWANLFTANDSIGSGDNGVWWIQHNSVNSAFEFALHTTSRSFIQAPTVISAGTWYHIAATYDGSFMRLYIDGNMEVASGKSGNIRSFPAASKLMLGSWANPGNNYRRFSGNIDEVSIWNINLSTTQINNLISNPELTTGTNYDTTGLLGYWNFDNNTADDLTACGNNGVICSGSALPIELTSFTVKKYNSNAEVNWQTASEINNDYFTVEKSKTATDDWFDYAIVNGAGNSSSIINYNLTDQNPYSGKSFYRLKQTDFDGQFTYSEIRTINIESPKIETFIYPNPTNDKITIQANKEELAFIKVHNTLGQDVSSQTKQISKNENQTILDLSLLPNGMYTVRTLTTVNKVYKTHTPY